MVESEVWENKKDLNERERERENIYILNASLSLVLLYIIIFYHITLSDSFHELIKFCK